MKIDSTILDNLIITQVPAIALGIVGFAFATWPRRSVESMNPAVAADAPTVSLRPGGTSLARPSLASMALAIALAALMVIVVLSQKINPKWPVSSAIDSTFWVALAGSAVALIWASFGGKIFGPLHGRTSHLATSTRVSLAVALLAAIIFAIYFACWLPVHGRVEQWSSQQQFARLLAALVLSHLLVGGLIALARRSTFGHVLAIGGMIGLASQMLALDFDALRFAMITGALATFFLVGAGITLLRASTRVLSRVAIVAAAAGAGVLLTNIYWQASLFGSASEGSALLYTSALCLAPCAALFVERIIARLTARSIRAGSLLASTSLALAPALGVVLVMAPALILCVIRSGILDPKDY